MSPSAERELSPPPAWAAAREATTRTEVKEEILRADPRRADRTECFKDVPSPGNAVGCSRFSPRDAVGQSNTLFWPFLK